MKKFGYILSWIGTVFFGILTNIFLFVELRTLFAGDWKLAENPTLGFFSYFFRSLFFLLMLFNAVMVIIRLINHQKITLNGLIFNASLIGGSIFTLIFYEWYFVIVIVLANIVTLAVRLKIEEKIEEKNED